MASIQELSTVPADDIKIVLLFWADWHDDSVALKESVLPALASSSNDDTLQFGSVEAEVQTALSEKYSVTLVPSFVFLNNGIVMERIEGDVEISDVTQAVQRLVVSKTPLQTATADTGTSSNDNDTSSSPTPEKEQISEEEALNARLKRLVRSSEVMLFMKGTPDAPRCGFSRQAIEILKENNIAFGSFDILTDNDVRQGLKTFSDWPTYPQLYAKGEFMGGLDIMKEMKEDGSASLADQLGVAPEPTLEDRLKKIINRDRIMVFMKGVPSAPRCGFSRQIVEILNENGASYDAFNILEDEQVRQGLKEYSDWPTYPQLYVDGDLVGGLDIVKEMVDSGDFKELIQG
mmetsp:Transcript_10259/g.14727  ORF Transcript_10259/g.14727 Transcript_10259/m.14727 type:complete len:347 (-) Transcript_10259:22-1062(-)